jgi:phospholipid/cholesterol/gamma-HCH transport system substrate-binding protein
MEPKQNYLVVGIFVVTLIAATLGFVVWLANVDDRRYDIYQTFIAESVNGLSEGAAVKYRGVNVGQVTLIEISRSNPSKIHILMSIDEETPITVGTVAVVQLQGITGISYIELRGTNANGQQIAAVGNNKYPIIPSQRSEFRQIVDSVPAMLEKFTDLANRMGNFASDENQQRFANIMINLEAFSNGVGGKDEEGRSLITELQKATTEMGQAAASIKDIADSSRQDAKQILKSTSETMAKISKLTDDTGTLTQKSYNDLNQLLLEIKKTARDLQGLSRDIKENPSKIIIPAQQGGVAVQ